MLILCLRLIVHILKLRRKVSFDLQGAHPSGKSQGNLIFLQGQGKVREFCKMVREIRKFFKVREKSGNFKIAFVQTPQKLNKRI